MIVSKKVKVKDLEFDCRVSGEGNTELVILLHGFPETSIMWTGIMHQLATLGFYCVAPDMRGYSKGACPIGVKYYSMDLLSTDITDIANALGTDRFHLIGHDWGAAIGWHLVFNNSERILSWTALSIPHTGAFARAYKNDPVQKKKSRYIGFFLLPILPEIILSRNDFKIFRRLWKHASPEALDDYLSVFSNKPCLTGALNYYRANLRSRKRQHIGDVETPTLFIWGKKDLAVGEAAARGTERYMKGDYTFLALEGGHWLMRSNFDEVQLAVVNHLQKYI